VIKARIPPENPGANLRNYPDIYQGFSWEQVQKTFSWAQTQRVNIVQEAVDRWTDDPETAQRPALIVEQGNRVESFTFKVKAGDRLFAFLPPCPETYLAFLGCARAGIIFCPLFSTLGLDELSLRIHDAEPLAILTHPDLLEHLPLEEMPSVRHMLVTKPPLPGLFQGEILVSKLLQGAPDETEPLWVGSRAPLYLIYTSGSTGPPKGVLHAHGDMVGILASARYVLDLSPGDVLWTDGDPAWVTGTVYSTFGPWLCGAASVIQAAPFSASTWYRTLERYRVNVWYTTPWRIHGLMEGGEDLPSRYDFGQLRHIATVGEALLPEALYWIKKNLGHTPHDTWWMSETGMICLANFPSAEVKPGSMGRPLPGIEAAILDEQGTPLPLLSLGELALKVPWPSMLIGIWNNEARFNSYFRHPGWFLTGDMALVDEEGYFYHQGRADDLIKGGEKLIGPYEIERILCQHPGVSEAAVISKASKPTEPLLKAFVTVGPYHTPSTRLGQEIKAYVRANLSPDIPLKEIEFLDELPKTGTGKVLRRVLRARELGLPGGNTENLKP